MSKINWEFSDGEIDNIVINEMEEKIGVIFPDDYKECVKLNQGASPSLNLFQVSNGIERVFGSLLKYINLDSFTNIYKHFIEYQDTLPKELVPFANDPGGNLICFDYKDHENDPIVVFWEHEGAWEKELWMQEEGLTAEQAEERARDNVFYAADNFTEFLDNLYEDEEDY